jgi:hypothetical protein
MIHIEGGKKMQYEKPVNPYQVLYFNPSIHSVKFAKMAEKYHNFRELSILNKVARLTGYDLIESSRLNWRQRDRWRDNKFRIGYFVYYLVPPGSVRLREDEYEE